MIRITSKIRRTYLTCLVLLGSLLCTYTSNAQQKIDVGIFKSTQTDQFEIRLKSNYDETLYLTNLQFTVRWPVQSNYTLNYLGPLAPYSLLAQGQYQSGGYNYWVFVSPGGSLLSMISGTEYVCANFSFTQSACVSFEIAADSWTQQNNGDYYIEINGIPKTGIIYQPAITYANAVGAAGNIAGLLNTCQNSQTTYTVAQISNATDYIWQYSGTNAIINANGTSVTLDFLNNSTSGYLTVAGSNSCGQGPASPPFYITVDPIPIIGPAINGLTSLCANSQNIIYSVANSAQAAAYNWTLPSGFSIVGSANNNSIEVNLSPLAQTGTISVFLSNTCGRSDTLDLQVAVNQNPNADAGNDTTISFGTIAYLNAANSGISNCSYHWLPENLVIQTLSQSTQTVLLTNSTIFTLLVTDTINGCQSQDHKQVLLTGGPLAIAPTLSNDSICQNDSVQLFANPCCGSGVYTYAWYSPTISNPLFQSTLANPWFKPSSSTFIYLVVSDDFNQDTAILEIFVKPAPTAFISHTDTICQNDSSAVTINFSGIPPYDFVITNGSISLVYNSILQNQLTIYLSQAGIYYISNFNDINCIGISSGTANITVTPTPVAPFISITGVNLISNYPAGNQWYNSNGPILGAVNQLYTPTVNGIYYNIVTINGCISPASNIINVTYIGIPDLTINSGIIAYPNPADNYIFLRLPPETKVQQLLLLNFLGMYLKDIGALPDKSSDIKLDVSDLKPGIYIILLKGKDNTMSSVKFIKN